MDRARYHYSITEAGLVAERKERKDSMRCVHTRTEGRDSSFTILDMFRQHYRYKKIEEGESSNSLTT